MVTPSDKSRSLPATTDDRAAFYWDENGPFAFVRMPDQVALVGAAGNDHTPFTLVRSLGCPATAFISDEAGRDPLAPPRPVPPGAGLYMSPASSTASRAAARPGSGMGARAAGGACQLGWGEVAPEPYSVDLGRAQAVRCRAPAGDDPEGEWREARDE